MTTPLRPLTRRVLALLADLPLAIVRRAYLWSYLDRVWCHLTVTLSVIALAIALWGRYRGRFLDSPRVSGRAPRDRRVMTDRITSDVLQTLIDDVRRGRRKVIMREVEPEDVSRDADAARRANASGQRVLWIGHADDDSAGHNGREYLVTHEEAMQVLDVDPDCWSKTAPESLRPRRDE